jgi:hypothetical protein
MNCCKSKWMPSLALVAMVAGCVAPYRPPEKTVPDPVLCLNTAQCAAMWSRAQVFVTTKSAYRLQLVSDSVIQTAGPIRNEVGLAFLVTRRMNEDGSGVITMESGCGLVYVGCTPSAALAARQFFDYVSGAVPGLN